VLPHSTAVVVGVLCDLAADSVLIDVTQQGIVGMRVGNQARKENAVNPLLAGNFIAGIWCSPDLQFQTT